MESDLTDGSGENAKRYAIYGALFGACFPIMSTSLQAALTFGGVSFDGMAQLQRTSPLLWVIDSAPLFLGLFAWLAGRRQDAVESLVAKLTATNAQLGRATRAVEEANEELEKTNHDLEDANAKLAKTNADLVEASRLKSQFLANMSHELRTPLNAIIGFSRIVLKKTETIIPEKQAKNLQMVHDSGRHLLDMVNDLLDIERIEAGMLRVTTTPVSVTSLVADAVQALTPAATEKRLELRAELGASPVRLRSDPVRLRQIVDNLVNNAIKYSDAGVIHVRLEVRPADAPEVVRVAVVDQGLGIPKEHLARIFDAFHQVDGSSTRAQGGVGLGLHLVKRLVEMLEGTVTVESEVGKGSTFAVTFPASLVIEGGGEELAVSRAPLEPAGEGPLLLVIDDQREAVEILRTELVEAGFRVESALTGEDGLAKAAALRPAAILLDMVMPGMDGWAVLKRLRSDPDLSATPVIVTSMLDDTPRAWDLGIVGWLTKPVAPADFLTVFKRIGVVPSADVLVVEDDRATLAMLVEQLTELGFQPRSAEDGRKAVEAVDVRLPQAVVLDLMLPHLDGFQVLEHLRKRRNGNDVPVVVYTAMDLSAEDRKRLVGGVVEVITKGTDDVHHVVSCVRRALSRAMKAATQEAR